MADYSAKIQLIVEGLQALNKVEQKLKELNKLVQNDLRVDVKASTGIKKIGEDLDAVAAKGRAAAKSITDSFKNLGGIAKGDVIAGAIVGINQFGAVLEAASAKAGLFGPTLDVIGSAVKGATPGVDALVNAFTALPPALQATAPAIAAVTAGLLAFNQPIRTAIADTKTLVDTLTPVKNAIKNAFSTTLLMAFGEQLNLNINYVNNYRGALLSLTDTVSELSRRKSNLQAVLNNNNASTETAAKIAAKLVDVTKRLNAEQQAQNDLLRQAAGLPTQSEERRATNRYSFTQNKKQYEATVQQELNAIDASIQRIAAKPVDWTRALGINEADLAANRAEALAAEWNKLNAEAEALANQAPQTAAALNAFKFKTLAENADAYTRALLNQQRTLDEYANAATRAADAGKGFGYAGEVPALRPAGFTNADVGIKNLLDDQIKAEKIITDLEISDNKAIANLEFELTQLQLSAELDRIDLVLNAETKALNVEGKAFDAELKRRANLQQVTEKASQTKRKIIENVAIGAGFPLLFGGGPGAVLGGAAGGLIPGNPILSVVTSAIGSLVDTFIAGITAMGTSVNDLIGNFESLRSAMLFTGKQQEYQIKLLIDSGRAQEAANLLQARFTEIIGSGGVQALSEVGKASEDASRAWAELTLQLQAALAGPLATILKLIGGGVKQQIATNDFNRALETDPIAFTKFVQKRNRQDNLSFRDLMFNPELNANRRIQLSREFLNQPKYNKNTPASLSLEQRAKALTDAEAIYTDLKEKERAQQDIKRQNAEQYFDLVLSLQRQQADLNTQYERKAQDLRLVNQQKELDFIKEKNNLELQQLENQATKNQIALGGGTGLQADITAALDKYNTELTRINQNSATAQKQLKLDLIKFDVENERFKLDNAKAIARTNYDNQLRINRINENIARQNAELNRKNYEQSIQVAAVQLSAVRADAQANKTIAEANLTSRTLTQDQVNYWQTILTGFKAVLSESSIAQKQVAQGFIKPSSLPSIAPAPVLTQPSTAGIDAQTGAAKNLLKEFNALEQSRKRQVNEETAYLALTQQVLQNVKQFDAQTKALKDEVEIRKIRNRLALEGVSPEIIEGEVRVLELTRQTAESTKALDNSIEKLLPKKLQNTNESYAAGVAYLAELETLGALTPEQEKLRKKLQDILDIRKALQDTTSTSVQDARNTALAQVKTPGEKVQESIGKSVQELQKLTDIGNIAIDVADGVGNAFADSFKGIVSGTMTAQQALASFFESVASAFLDMAAKIIAKWIEMTILNTILSLFPGGGFKSPGIGNTFSNFNPAGAVSAGTGGIPSIAASFRAAGGPVTGNSPYIVGERGPELFVPGRSGTIVPNGAMGGSTVKVDSVNITVQNTGDTLNPEAQKQIARQVQTVVLATLIDQRRNGGVLR